MIRQFIKYYLKGIPRHLRPIRQLFVGRRLAIRQYRWLHFTNHPWELLEREHEGADNE